MHTRSPSGRLAGLIALTLAGCAATPPPEAGRFHHGRGGFVDERGPGVARRGQLFISPSGEPFRAAGVEPYPVAAWFAQADADHDGRLTRAEFRADAARFFRLLDRNVDGVVDGAEVSLYEREVVPEILIGLRPEARLGNGGADRPGGSARLILAAFQDGQDAGASGGGGGRPGRGHGGGRRRGDGGAARAPGHAGLAGAAFYGLLNEPEPVASADLRFNGRITPEAFAQVADHRFDLLDTRKREFLTLADLPETPFQRALQARDRGRVEGR